MNKYYSKLNLPAEVAINFDYLLPLLDKRKNIKLEDTIFLDSTHTWLEQTMGLKFYHIELLSLEASQKYTIHVDGNSLDDKAKFNFIYKGAGSTLSWYETESPDDIVVNINNVGKPYTTARPGSLNEVFSTEVSGFNIINAGVFHGVKNKEEYRAAISTSLVDAVSGYRPTYPELAERFKNYIL